MKTKIRKSIKPLSIMIACMLLFFVALFSLGTSKVTHADNGDDNKSGHILTIYDRGIKTVIVTHQSTIGDALKESKIIVDDRDVVEPSIDSKLIASDYSVNIYRARPVVIVDGNTRIKIITAFQTAEQIVASAGMTLFDEDTATLGPTDDIISDGVGLQVNIKRAIPIKLLLYGKEIALRTQAKTVGQMLKSKGISLSREDLSVPDLDEPITAGQAVKIWREGRQVVSVDESVPFDTEKIEDADRDYGYSEVKTPGELGMRNVSYEIVVQDGVEVSRTEIASVITKNPKNQVEVIGVKLLLTAGYSAERVSLMAQAGISGDSQGYAAYIIDNENALWCPTRWQGQTGCPAVYAEKFPGAEASNQVGYGICQATPGNKMASAGSDWRTNPVTQLKWCNGYALSRYGSWRAAYEFKSTRGWW